MNSPKLSLISKSKDRKSQVGCDNLKSKSKMGMQEFIIARSKSPLLSQGPVLAEGRRSVVGSVLSARKGVQPSEQKPQRVGSAPKRTTSATRPEKAVSSENGNQIKIRKEKKQRMQQQLLLPYKVSAHQSLQAYQNTFSQNLQTSVTKIKNQDLNVKILKEKIRESEGKFEFKKKNPYISKNSNLLIKSVTSAYGKMLYMNCKNRSSTPQNIIQNNNNDAKTTSKGFEALSSNEKSRVRPNSVTARTGKLVAAIEGIQTSRNLYLQKLEENKIKEAAESAEKEQQSSAPENSKEVLQRLQKSYSSKRITINDGHNQKSQEAKFQKIKFKGYTNKNLVLPRKVYQMADIEKKANTTQAASGPETFIVKQKASTGETKEEIKMRQVDDKKAAGTKKQFKIRNNTKPLEQDIQKKAGENVKAMSTKSLLRSSLKEMAGQLESQGVIGCMKKSVSNTNADKMKKFKVVPTLKLKTDKLGEDVVLTTRAVPRSTSALCGTSRGGDSKDLSQYFDRKKSFLQGFVNDRDKLRQVLSQRAQSQEKKQLFEESKLKVSSPAKIIQNLKNIIEQSENNQVKDQIDKEQKPQVKTSITSNHNEPAREVPKLEPLKEPLTKKDQSTVIESSKPPKPQIVTLKPLENKTSQDNKMIDQVIDEELAKHELKIINEHQEVIKQQHLVKNDESIKQTDCILRQNKSAKDFKIRTIKDNKPVAVDITPDKVSKSSYSQDEFHDTGRDGLEDSEGEFDEYTLNSDPKSKGRRAIQEVMQAKQSEEVPKSELNILIPDKFASFGAPEKPESEFQTATLGQKTEDAEQEDIVTESKQVEESQIIQSTARRAPTMTKQSSAHSHHSLSSTAKNRDPHLLTFNENGPQFPTQAQLFDVAKNTQNSQFLNSTQTFQKFSASRGNNPNDNSLQTSSIQSPSIVITGKEKMKELLPEVIEEEQYEIVPAGERSKMQQSQDGLSKSKSQSLKAISKKDEDVDAMVNDEDLSVYEDVDCEDSSDEEEMSLALDSGKNGSSLMGPGSKTKLSGYRLIKQMEDSRQNSSKNYSNIAQPVVYQQNKEGDTMNISQTAGSRDAGSNQRKEESQVDDTLNRSLAKSKSSDHLLGGANPELKMELRRFLDEQFEEKQSLSNKREKPEDDPKVTDYRDVCTGLQGYLNESIKNQAAAFANMPSVIAPKQNEYQIQAQMKMSLESGFGQLWYAQKHQMQQTQMSSQTSRIQSAQPMSEEYAQSFEIGNYGKKASGMAPSLLKSNKLPLAFQHISKNPQTRQRPLSMIVQNSNNITDPSKTIYSQSKVPPPAPPRLMSSQGVSKTPLASDPKKMTFNSNLLLQAQQALKRRKIRPISSMCAKKANLPQCFLEDPRQNQGEKASKRVSSAHHLLNQGQKNDFTASLSTTPPPQAIKVDNFQAPVAQSSLTPEQKEQIVFLQKKPQIPRPESSYGKSKRTQNVQQFLSSSKAQKFIASEPPEEPKIEILDLCSKDDVSKVFANTPKNQSKGNPHAKKPPRIQSGQLANKNRISSAISRASQPKNVFLDPNMPSEIHQKQNFQQTE